MRLHYFMLYIIHSAYMLTPTCVHVYMFKRFIHCKLSIHSNALFRNDDAFGRRPPRIHNFSRASYTAIYDSLKQ